MRVEKNKDYQFEEDQFLYKYMDIHRLIYFLTTGRLFFSPLSYFDDPLEGISETLLFHRRQTIESDAPDGNAEAGNKFYTNYLEKIQRTLFASCWFLGIRESLAVWESYSNKDSVALRFNPEHLCEVMISNFNEINDPDFEAMIHGKVEYYKLSPFDPGDSALRKCGHRYTGFLKDISYKHEEEFRFLLMRTQETQENEYFEFSPGPLKDLQFTVISHPNMELWKFNNIANILKVVGLEDRLEHSKIPTRRKMFQREI